MMGAHLKESLQRAESTLPDEAQAQVAEFVDGVVENYEALKRDGLTVDEFIDLKQVSSRPSQPVSDADMTAFFEKYGL